MQILSTLCSVVAVISALFLIVIILMQDNKSGGGLGGLMGGSEAMFGGETASVLVKITTWLAVIFLIATLGKASILGHGTRTGAASAYSDIADAAAPVEAEAPAAPAEAAPVVPVEEVPAAE